MELPEKKKKVSVIIPIYNAAGFLHKCLDSILQQTYQNIEIICVDDGSDDSSMEIISSYVENDSRIHLISQETNMGAYIARKRGVTAANGDYICFVDADDYVDHGLIEELVNLKCDADIVHFMTEVENCGIESEYYDEMRDFTIPLLENLAGSDVLRKCFIERRYGWNIWNKMFSATVCKKAVDRLEERYVGKANDILLFFAIAAESRSYVGHITRNKYHYNFGNGSTLKQLHSGAEFVKIYNYGSYYGLIRHIVESMNQITDKECLEHSAENILEIILKETIETWIFRLEGNSKADALSVLMQKQYIVDIVDMFFNEFPEYKNILAGSLLKGDLIQKSKNTTKRIAFYYKKYGQGGVERVISLLIPLFLKAGYGVVLITEVPEEKNDFTLPNGVKRYVIPSKNDIDAGRIRYRERGKRLLDIYEKESIDTVCYEESSSRYLMYDLIVTKSAGIKFIVSKHELFSQHFVFNRDILTDEMSSYPLADAITVLSKEEETFWRTLGVKSYLIPNPLTLEKTANYRYNCDADEIVWVGRLDRNQKQYQEIVPIIKEVVKSVPNIIINIYGAPETYKDLYLLEHQIKEEGLEKNIRYMGYSNSIEDIFSNASMMLMTSAYESSPMVILESKQFGVPIVMYSMPYIEILKDGKGYIAVNQGDSTAASGAVVQLIKNREYRIRLSEEASSSLETYSDDYVMEQWGNLLSGNISCEIDTRTVYENILRTMTFHMSLGCAKYDELAKNNRKLIEENKIETIKRIQNERKLKIALYPFGNLGRKLHAKLTNNQIDISLIVDNAGYVDGHEVVTLKDLKGKNIDEYLFVITSNNMKYYDEIRSNLRGIVSERNIFDWYPVDEVL